jgi:hypothetical protein
MGFKSDFRQWDHLLRIGIDHGYPCERSRSNKSVDFRKVVVDIKYVIALPESLW